MPVLSRCFVWVFCLFALSGCLKPYTPSIHQGNVLASSTVNQIKLGMTQDQVQYILGAPILTSPFQTSTWYYVYTYQPQDSKQVIEKKLILTFDSKGALIKIANQSPAE